MGIPGNNGLSMMEGQIILADFRSYVLCVISISPRCIVLLLVSTAFSIC